MTRKIRIAIGHMAGTLGDTPGNIALACKLSLSAAERGARIILFPEGCLNGNAFRRDRQESMPISAAAFAKLQSVADAHDIVICVGFTTPVAGGLNNAHAVLTPKSKLRVQYKCARSPQEPEFLVAWPDITRTTFQIDGIRVAISICVENGLPHIDAAVADVAPDLLLFPSGGCMQPDEVVHGEPTQKTEAFLNGCAAIVANAAVAAGRDTLCRLCANPLGFDGETWWPGNSFALNADGKITLWMKAENRPEFMTPSVGVTDMVFSSKATRERVTV